MPEPGASGLDDRTVVIVDEASMASTLALDPLITAAAWAGAKVVLVGDPAQIGVVNGPGGMLAALAQRLRILPACPQRGIVLALAWPSLTERRRRPPSRAAALPLLLPPLRGHRVTR